MNTVRPNTAQSHDDRDTHAEQARAMPLQQRLALLITSVVVFVLVLTLVITYVALSRTSAVETSQRLAGAVQLVGALGAQNVAARLDSLRRAAENDSVRMVFRPARADRSPADRARDLQDARVVLERLRSTVPDAPPHVQLWNLAGERVLSVASDTALRAPVDSHTVLPVRLSGLGGIQPADSVLFGSFFFEAPDSAYYWNVAPVKIDGSLAGYLAHKIRLQLTQATSQRVREVAGDEVRLLLVSNDRRNWMDLSGGQTRPRVTRDSVGVGRWYDSPNGRVLGAEVHVLASGFGMMLETPRRIVQSRTNDLLLTIAAIGLLVTLIGAIVAYYVGRRIARPINLLTTAAEQVAAGAGARRVPVEGDDEVGRLATSFNAMVTQVETARRALQQRFEETQAAANQLETSNTQLQRAMREADHAREEAQNANRAKSDFLAVMSHELRTPLNAIGGYTQLIELEVHGPINPSQREALQRVSRSQAHLLRLINDVLNFARVDAGHVRYAMADVPLDETLRSVELLIVPQLRAKGLTFGYETCEESVTVYADGEKLKQVLLNLLTNAIKFTPSGGHIGMRCTEGDEVIRILVSDDGVGIPRERLETIFDPFVQLERPNPGATADGVGLGLAISRDLARGMGGELDVESTVGAGSTFAVTLRATADADPIRVATGEHRAVAERAVIR